MKKFFLFDIETGGTNLKTSLLSLHGIVLNEKLEVLDTIVLNIKPNNGLYVLSPKALEIEQFNLIEHDKKAIFKHEASKLFYNFVCKHSYSGKMIPVGHNASSHIDFVKKNLLKTSNFSKKDWSRFFSPKVLDTSTITSFLKLSEQLPPSLSCKPENLAKHLEIDFTDNSLKCRVLLTLEILKKFIALTNSTAAF